MDDINDAREIDGRWGRGMTEIRLIDKTKHG